MYTSYYGFRQKPFQTISDPAHLFMSRGHADVYAHLEYALMEDKGFMVVTGAAGSGKTSLINLLTREFGTRLTIAVLRPDIVPLGRFTEEMSRRFAPGISDIDTAEMSGAFRDFLIGKRSAGSRAVLIVNEAQGLTDTAIEEIRMLANLRTGRRYLIQIILVGRPELKERLCQNRVHLFVQRVTVCRHLPGLKSDEVGRYIRHRLQYTAGARRLNIFDQGAIESIYRYSGGIPRCINIISDAALVYGYADELQTIGEGVIEDVMKGRDAPGGANRPLEPVETGTDNEETDGPIRRDVERKIHTLETVVSLINQGVSARNPAGENRGEAGL